MRICLGARGRYEGIGKGVDVDGFRMFRCLGAMRKKNGYGMYSVCVKLGADEIGMRKEG